MIISKPSIESFLEEANDPIYVQIITRPNRNSCTVEFHATAFNAQDRPLSYLVQFPNYFIFDELAKERIESDAKKLEEKFKIEAVSRKIMPGVIAEKVISGEMPRLT